MSPGVAGLEMEDANRRAAPRLADDGAMEARFAYLCKSALGLDDCTTEEANALFGKSKQILLGILSSVGSQSMELVERHWSAFLLYCVTGLSSTKQRKENEDSGVKLFQILEVAKLNALDFFKEISHFALKIDNVLSCHYSPDWERRIRLKELYANVDQLCCLSRFYKKAYHQLFKVSDDYNWNNLLFSNHENYVSDYHYFGWLLLLALRAHGFSRFKDLVTCTNALVSILALLMLHVPISLRNFTISNSPFFTKKSDNGVDLLASLSQTYDASEEELRSMMEKINNLIVDVLKKKPCPASECITENFCDINTDGLTYFKDLQDEKSFQKDVLILDKHYNDIIKCKIDLDERVFLNIEDNLAPVTSPTKLITNFVTSHHNASPVNGNFVRNSGMTQLTPVSTSMTTAKWLREVVSPFPSRPSSGLQRYLASCDTDLTNPVTYRANIILESVFPSHYGERCIPGSLQGSNLMDSVWAEQRKLESMKLYYRVLEAICKAESQRLSGNNLSSLLSNERFHRCMLACAAELVLATHRTVTMMFPAVLERTGITAFDLSKVIECFVRHEETLPRELKRHLNSLEERLLESMTWEKGSSLYNSLVVARPGLAAEINRLGLLAEPMPSLDSIALQRSIPTGGIQPGSSQKHGGSSGQMGDSRSPKRFCSENRGLLSDHNVFTSPVKENLLTFNSPRSKLSLQSAFASPACPNPSTSGETCAEAGISTFFSKILKLAAIRIRSLCERLGQPQQILELVYFLIQQLLNQRTALFYNRHIDQLILCSIYGVNKILNVDLTFKAIIYNYKKQPQCRTQVFRSVYVNWSSVHNTVKKGHEHIDIVTFYNAVFIPSVKPLLMELGPLKVESSNSLAQDKTNHNGNIPASPRLSTFPNLPDMSPKKVSASHNVYVSPLRQSKMDALLAPSSKSYYACVGESTHAFQSPSKDLMVINSRLNCGGGRRVGGRLNFDLVSDSIVAGSLGPQNGSSGSSPAGSIMDVTVKSEQPEL